MEFSYSYKLFFKLNFSGFGSTRVIKLVKVNENEDIIVKPVEIKEKKSTNLLSFEHGDRLKFN